MRRAKEVQEIEDSMVGSILVGDLLGKEEEQLLGGPLPLLLVGNRQGVLDESGQKNIFVVNAHQIFLQKLPFPNLQSFHWLICALATGVK